MRISEIFNMGMSQYELDFIDIDPRRDIPLFIDPYFISKCEFPLARDAHYRIKSFFEHLLKQLKANDIQRAHELFSYLSEPNASDCEISTI